MYLFDVPCHGKEKLHSAAWERRNRLNVWMNCKYLLGGFLSLDHIYCTLLTSCVLIFNKVDKPKQNGSADGEDALQGSKQGERVCSTF